MKRVLSLLHLFAMFYCFASSIVIGNNRAFVDQNKKMILINQNVDELNGSNNAINFVNIEGAQFQFTNTVSKLEIGKKYTVKKENVDYALYFTELPIVEMIVNDPIVDSPKVLGDFIIIDNNGNAVESTIGVEYRGASSQAYPKKSMEIEFWKDEEGEDTEDLSLLGLRETDSYNLQAIYNEPLRVNSKLSNDLWRKIHPIHYLDLEPEAVNGITMKFVELFLNGEYRGVYSLGEKVSRGQLKLKKYKDGVIRGELYKGDTWGGTTFTSLIPFDNNLDVWNGFEYKQPKEVIDWSSLYNLVDFVMHSNGDDFAANYNQKFEMDNILDYFIFINLARATDNLGKNMYFAKYDENGKYFFVPWDLDGTFGFIWDGTRQDITNDLLFNGLYSRLWNDSVFREKLTARWGDLREQLITKESIIQLFTDNVNYLYDNKVYDRESLAWGHNYNTTDFDYMRGWVSKRIDYLDETFGLQLSTTNVVKSNQDLKIYPNPASDYFTIDLSGSENAEVTIIDYSGKILKSKTHYKNGDKIDVSEIKTGVYFVIAEIGNTIKTNRIIIK